MKNFLSSTTLAVTAMAASLLAWSGAPARAQQSPDQLRQFASKLVADLALACPHSAIRDPKAYETCLNTLKDRTDLPLSSFVLWGGDQPTLPIKNRKLTRFSADVFRTTYMPFLTFTGRYTIDRNEQEKVNIIRVEAYFRNDLSPGDYPYPFWHASEKWDAYEKMNRLNIYVNDSGRITVFTRSDDGSNANRGNYAHVNTPAFVKDQWMWTDSSGQQQPRVMLFTTRYQATNPQMPKLDETYRAFAATMREASCIACHVPNNPPGARQLILLQTPLHAAGEVDRVIRSVQGGNMPLDDVGLPKDIEPSLREQILRTAQDFRSALTAADQWEASQRRAMSGSDLPAQPAR